MFSEVVKNQWSWPGAFPNPGGNDCQFYNMEQAASQILQVPSIDAPVAALATSSSLVAGDIADNLEDKKGERTLQKAELTL